MENLFEVVDKTGRKIRLTEKQWSHILTHGDVGVGELENIKTALSNPSSLLVQDLDKNKGNYYLYQKERKRYLLVVVKYLNGEGFVITAFYVKDIRK
jgi:hypothetical protein